MRGVAGSERDVDEVRKEGGKTVLEKVFQRKVAMPKKKKKKKHHVTCLETFSALVSVLSCCFPYLFGRRQKAKFCSSFLSSDYKWDKFWSILLFQSLISGLGWCVLRYKLPEIIFHRLHLYIICSVDIVLVPWTKRSWLTLLLVTLPITCDRLFQKDCNLYTSPSGS